MIGRIETYVHSDSTTANKGAILAKITCDTDFAARTDAFKQFAHRAAMLAYATIKSPRCYIGGPDIWAQVVALFPDAEVERLSVERELKETIKVVEIAILKL